MPGPVYSIVRRNMKHTSEGAFTRKGEALERMKPVLPLENGEELVGLYRNPSPWEDSVVVFSSLALYVIEGQAVECIPIDQIIGYERPKSKENVMGVTVLTKTTSLFVRVAGSFGPNGNQKDAFSFIMVLRGLIPGELVVDEQSD